MVRMVPFYVTYMLPQFKKGVRKSPGCLGRLDHKGAGHRETERRVRSPDAGRRAAAERGALRALTVQQTRFLGLLPVWCEHLQGQTALT